MSAPIDFEGLRERLADSGMPSAAEDADARQAAVAAILRGDDCHAPLEVLLMRRAQRPGDRWSGQISLPGGHAEAVDADLAATARRETQEEVGLDLETSGELIGALPRIQARARGGLVGTFVTPLVFRDPGVAELTLGPEADDAFWMPLLQAREGAFDRPYPYRSGEVVYQLPSWHFEDQIVWGLTHRILFELFELLDAVDGRVTRTTAPRGR